MRPLTSWMVVGLAAAALIGSAPAATAMSNISPPPTAAADPDLTAGKQALDKRDWPAAIESLSKAAARDDKNADVQNWLGYAYRNMGNYDQAFVHYEKALAIEPDHRGAHEYVGEAYLLVGDLAKAEEHLQALDKLCLFGCAEYTELKTKIADYKKQKTS